MMEDIKQPKELPNYRLIERRAGRPLERLLDVQNREAEQVIYRPNFVARRRRRKKI